MVFLAAAAAQFGRDLELDLGRVESLVAAARRAGASLLVLPDGTLGGHCTEPRDSGGLLRSQRYLARPETDCEPPDLPPALAADDTIFDRVAATAGEMVVCLGYHERDGDRSYNAAVCLSGAGVHGRHRKVHLTPGERISYTPGDRFAAFDTPVGRIGMLIDYDKAFPEGARSLADDGAVILACLSAWPCTPADPGRSIAKDPQSRLFDLFDCARAAENQVVLVSANQTGRSGALTFIGNAKVVGPGGDIRARTWTKAGLAVAELDPAVEVPMTRRVLHHLEERRPAAYRTEPGRSRKPPPPDAALLEP